MRSLILSLCALWLAFVASCDPDPGVRYWQGPDARALGDGESGAVYASGPPAPYTQALQSAPRCELSADCPNGTYCDLGQCFQQCSTKQACADGFQCNPRGLCVMHEEESSDPPITTEPTMKVEAKESALAISGVATELALEFTADGDEEVRYRVDSRAPWLRVREDRGAFKHALTVQLEVDPSKRPNGEVSGTIALRTNCGDVVVTVHVEESLSGVYKGSLVYEAPREFGRVPLMIDVVDRGNGYVNVRIRPEGSPTFPAEGGKAATFSGRADEGAFNGLLQKLVHPADLGPGRTALTHDVGHEVRFVLTPSRAGLAGTFEERWVGLLPTDQRTKGKVTLRRVLGEAPGTFEVAGVPVFPSPARPAPALKSACIAAVGCSGTPSNHEAAACGSTALGRGAIEVTDKALLVPDAKGRGYQEWAGICGREWASGSAKEKAMECVDRAMLDCAHDFFTYAFMRGVGKGYTGAMDVAARRAGAAILIVDDTISEAYRRPYENPSSATPNAVLGIFNKAHGVAVEALRASFAPFLLQSLHDMATSYAAQGDFLALRRFAQLLGRSREISEGRLAIMRRGVSRGLGEVRDAARTETLNLLLGAVSLTGLLQKHAAPPALEWGFLDGLLTQIAAQTVDLEYVDAFGYPKGFVPYIYNAKKAGLQKSTNLDFLVEQASAALATALADEKAADEAYETYAHTVEELERDLIELNTQRRSRLIEICGTHQGTGEPDVDRCEQGSGLMGQALGHHGTAVAAVEVAAQRIEELHQRVEIHAERLQTIDGIHGDLIAFTNGNNQRINALEKSRAKLGLVRGFLSSLNFSNAYAFAASYFTAGSALSLSMSEQQIEHSIRELQQLQQVKMLETDRRKAYVDGMTVIKELLISEESLLLEMRVSALQAATSGLEIEQLVDRKRAIELEYDLFKNLKVQSLANRPLFRVLKESKIRKAHVSRETALRWAYLAGLGFEFELNMSLPGIRDRLLPALRAETIGSFLGCISLKQADYDLVYASPDTRVDEISMRRDVLGILGPRTDEVTGEVIDEGEQFRRHFFRPSNVTAHGDFVLKFSTSIDPGNGVWSTGLCNDQIRTLELKIVGDNLGDHQATIRLSQDGIAIQRSCNAFRQGASDMLRQYKIENPRTAEIQAGVNTYGSTPSSELFGSSVAATEWTLTIPPPSQAPRNRDLDLELIDDIVVRVHHEARTLSDGPANYDPSCR